MKKHKAGTAFQVIRNAALLLLFCGLFYGYAAYHGMVLLNHPSEKKYPVRGVDVSHYQGQIDWTVLAGQGIDFAYIKATEGSSHKDEKFEENWENAGKTYLRLGAYHFFSFDSPGAGQLENFIGAVPEDDEALPPAVDLEFYGDKRANPPSPEAVREQLTVLLHGLESHYGVRPMIYATEETYHLYVEDYFKDYPLWIRNVIGRPGIEDSRWLMWQYTNRQKLKGYKGEEPYIDMNVFNGSRDEWELWYRNREKGWN